MYIRVFKPLTQKNFLKMKIINKDTENYKIK